MSESTQFELIQTELSAEERSLENKICEMENNHTIDSTCSSSDIETVCEPTTTPLSEEMTDEMADILCSSNEGVLGSFSDMFDSQPGLPADEERYFKNDFIKGLVNNRGLMIRKEALVDRSFSNSAELGLFNIFLNKSFFESVRSWTNGGRMSNCKNFSIEEI